jgi:RHS repeat-associated protein
VLHEQEMYLDNTASWAWQQLSIGKLATVDCWAEVYVENLSSQAVWFDDLEIATGALPVAVVVQETHYDPWGLELSGIGYVAEASKESDFKFQGKELVGDFGLGWYDFMWRQYDPVLGRATSVDPHARDYLSLSPFMFLGNNPMRMTDPDGRNFGDFWSQSGEWLGSDGKDDHKNYVVTNSREARTIKENLQNRRVTTTESVTSRVELPSRNVRQQMQAAVDRTKRPTADDRRGGFHEEGGMFGTSGGQEKVIDAKAGKYSNPASDTYAEIDLFSGETPTNSLDVISGTFHTHPPGTTGNASFSQSPSDFEKDGVKVGDIPSAKSWADPNSARHVTGNSYVLGVGNNKVSIYNGTGTVATFPLNKLSKVMTLADAMRMFTIAK